MISQYRNEPFLIYVEDILERNIKKCMLTKTTLNIKYR